MANILQVTTPPVNTDNRTMPGNQEAPNSIHDTRIHNPADPSRVVRADGQESGKTGDATGEGGYRVIDYESNYGAFVQKLKDGGELSKLLTRLLFSDMSDLKSLAKIDMGTLMDRFFTAINVSSPEELAAFMKSQQNLQTGYGSSFFDGLRALMSQTPSEGLREAVMNFLKGYNDYTSGPHLLYQMKTLTDDIGRLMYKQYREEFTQLASVVKWDADMGDTAYNTGILNDRLIPFLSTYISKTRDFGPIRDAALLFIFHAVRYENGGEEKLWKLFTRMTDQGDFARLFKGDAASMLEQTLEMSSRQRETANFADTFSQLLLKGANGEAGLENIQQFYTMMNGMLLNESVYLPLLHILFPFQFQDKRVMSEAWIDPDAKKTEEEEGRRIKLYLKFDIQSLGKFEMVLSLQNRTVKMKLSVPSSLNDRASQVRETVSGIIKKNGFEPVQLSVQELLREGRVEEIFPMIREKEKTINVRI
ncbi:hypothetical protein [Hungatella hathewayi]|uniref:hypothetical protein n=1 Tax=Hungatella hathewayi TaxID=154046 RepID=UPI003564022B